jgi:hypothetical protein
MAEPSLIEIDVLRADLGCLRKQAFTGVLVGVGSIILHFGGGSCALLIQCPFEVHEGGISKNGHGHSRETSVILFDFLNQDVVDTHVDPSGQIALEFSERRTVKIIPDHSGFESYVLSTPKGVHPVF